MPASLWVGYDLEIEYETKYLLSKSLTLDVLQSFENERLVVSGWGREENGGKQSNALKAIISHGISNRVRNRLLLDLVHIKPLWFW